MDILRFTLPPEYSTGEKILRLEFFTETLPDGTLKVAVAYDLEPRQKIIQEHMDVQTGHGSQTALLSFVWAKDPEAAQDDPTEEPAWQPCNWYGRPLQDVDPDVFSDEELDRLEQVVDQVFTPEQDTQDVDEEDDDATQEA